MCFSFHHIVSRLRHRGSPWQSHSADLASSDRFHQHTHRLYLYTAHLNTQTQKIMYIWKLIASFCPKGLLLSLYCFVYLKLSDEGTSLFIWISQNNYIKVHCNVSEYSFSRDRIKRFVIINCHNFIFQIILKIFFFKMSKLYTLDLWRFYIIWVSIVTEIHFWRVKPDVKKTKYNVNCVSCSIHTVLSCFTFSTIHFIRGFGAIWVLITNFVVVHTLTVFWTLELCHAHWQDTAGTKKTPTFSYTGLTFCDAVKWDDKQIPQFLSSRPLGQSLSPSQAGTHRPLVVHRNWPGHAGKHVQPLWISFYLEVYNLYFFARVAYDRICWRRCSAAEGLALWVTPVMSSGQ